MSVQQKTTWWKGILAAVVRIPDVFLLAVLFNLAVSVR